MLRDEIKKIVADVLETQGVSGVDFVVEHPEQAEHGDYATNAALVCAPALRSLGEGGKDAGVNPRVLAEQLKERIEQTDTPLISRIEVAGPGFINFHITNEVIARELDALQQQIPSGFLFKTGKDINIEFVSANPTGALHIGHGRGAFFGDILANVLAFAGARVTREYYINDSRESGQIQELGKTALGEGEQYKTPLVAELIEQTDVSGCSESDAGFLLAQKIQATNKRFLQEALGVSFDVWFSEDEELRATGATNDIIEKLKPFSYESEGAVWLRTSEYGDDEDRVIIRSDGSASYFVADIAYHAHKFARGFHEVVNVWGADHQGHVKRMHAVGKMLGWPQDPPQPIIFVSQLVSLKKEGRLEKMSKRAGTVVYLEDLLAETNADVVRWFFAEKALNTHMEFDMDLAKEQSEKNPVYYVQYAHARIASIIARAEGFTADEWTLTDVLEHKAAHTLAKKLITFPELIQDVSREYNVHALTTYAHELAQAFSSFYHEVRVIEDDTYNAGAYALSCATRDVLAQTLALLGVHAPENM